MDLGNKELQNFNFVQSDKEEDNAKFPMINPDLLDLDLVDNDNVSNELVGSTIIDNILLLNEQFYEYLMYAEFFWADWDTHQTHKGATMVGAEWINFQNLCLQIL